MRRAGGCALLVLAKAPWPGRAKTRLSPPCTPAQAARLAGAALTDTLSAVAATPASRRVLVLDGVLEGTGVAVPPGYEILPQRGGGLDERLEAAFADAADGGPALLVGMDTPQLSPQLLSRATGLLLQPGVGAVLGGAPDGGWWAAGLRRARPGAFFGVPMSTAGTCAAQRQRLEGMGLVVRDLPSLRDVDHYDDALAVAADCAAGSRFAAEMAGLSGLATTAGTAR